MDGTLDTFATSNAPLAERTRIARELARAVADLHRRGRVHGALAPCSVVIASGEVVLTSARAGNAPGFDAPEVARGRRATRRSDAFSLGALAQLALTGRAPFEAEAPLESIRRVLFVEAAPPRLTEPRLSHEVENAIVRLLEKRPRRRANPLDLVRAIEAATAPPREVASAPATCRATTTPPSSGTLTPTATPTATATSTATAIPTATPTSTPTSTSTSTSPATATATPTPTATATSTPTPTPATARIAIAARTPTLGAVASIRTAGVRLLPNPRLLRVMVAAVPALVAGLGASLAVGMGGDGALAREVSESIAHGDYATARRRLDEAARGRRDDPVVEKLRGDLACARRTPQECIRRYRIALAARPELRDDPTLRRNARALLRRDQACGTRRAAAQLLGEMRDRDALPALEEARRGGGLFAFLCTGDAIDRAIAAVRTGPKGDGR